MKFSIVFENSGDEIPFHVVHNQDLISWYIEKANRENCDKNFLILADHTFPTSVWSFHSVNKHTKN